MSSLLLGRLSDQSLGRRLAAGEAAAFDELYRRYSHRLAAYGAYLLGDAASGEDVAQATLLKAYGALRDGRNPEHVRPWLYRIAHNASLDILGRRRELPSPDLPERAAPAHGPSPGALVEAVAALPDTQRKVYVLRELHGLRIDETAHELALSRAQVEQALFAARNRMAEHLVFGERLNCVAVRRLAAGPLDGDERRALRTHMRSCLDCRRSLGAKGRAYGAFPIDAFGWLRALPGLLAGGGAPAAVKVGAVVATATLAAGTPIGYEIAREQNPPRVAAHAVAEPRSHGAPDHVAAARRVANRPHVTPVALAVGRVAVPQVERTQERHDASAPRERGSAPAHESAHRGPGPRRSQDSHELEAIASQDGGGDSRHAPEHVPTTPASSPPPVTVPSLQPAPSPAAASTSGHDGDGGTTTVSSSGDGVSGGGMGTSGSDGSGGSDHGGSSADASSDGGASGGGGHDSASDVAPHD